MSRPTRRDIEKQITDLAPAADAPDPHHTFASWARFEGLTDAETHRLWGKVYERASVEGRHPQELAYALALQGKLFAPNEDTDADPEADEP